MGKDITAAELKKEFDAVLLCLGATWPRDLPIPNRDAKVSSRKKEKEVFSMNK